MSGERGARGRGTEAVTAARGGGRRPAFIALEERPHEVKRLALDAVCTCGLHTYGAILFQRLLAASELGFELLDAGGVATAAALAAAQCGLDINSIAASWSDAASTGSMPRSEAVGKRATPARRSNLFSPGSRRLGPSGQPLRRQGNWAAPQ